MQLFQGYVFHFLTGLLSAAVTAPGQDTSAAFGLLHTKLLLLASSHRLLQETE